MRPEPRPLILVEAILLYRRLLHICNVDGNNIRWVEILGWEHHRRFVLSSDDSVYPDWRRVLLISRLLYMDDEADETKIA